MRSVIDQTENREISDDEIKALLAKLLEAQAKTEEQLAKTDAKLDRLADRYGRVSATRATTPCSSIGYASRTRLNGFQKAA